MPTDPSFHGDEVAMFLMQFEPTLVVVPMVILPS